MSRTEGSKDKKKRKIHKKNCICITCKAKRGETFGENNGMFGKKQNKKTKEKISKSKIGKLKGNKNPSKRLDVRKKISKALKGRKNTWSIKTKGIKRPNTSQSLVKAYK
ncbi:hypothetical protein LCGC14_2505650, partial [marine sediment metagenome]